ncbi:extracellular calcium-sensing receptor-like [Girardinichthys multiradiatus]|uniref:extracellular calcium-sensing receptor-like n=1 Tax=Girardinichthys multiradiatus TaxID=208333 RepID=UPI001FAB5C90|nr:extracellular calcium-sensing receptor-like [Girardinichthys multiradiatus]
MFKQGHIMIGGIFPIFNKEISSTSRFEWEPLGVTCEGFDLRAFRWTQVMIFAIDEINKDPALLPNISLGYRIFDSCASPTNAVRAALTLGGQPDGIELTSSCPPAISALIAESGSSQSLAVSETLGPFQVPIVSYFSTCACLSNRAKYPTFFRTIPSDYFQAKALAALIKHFGWEWIGVIQSDNDYGQNGILAFTEEIKTLKICIAFIGTVLRTYPLDKILKVVEMIKQSTVKVILAFVPEGDFYPLMKEIVKQNITGIQWIASEAWITAARPSTPQMYQAFGGALGFVVQKMAIPNLNPFLTDINPYRDPSEPFVKDFWEIIVTYHLQRVNFRNQFGDYVFFDENGNPPASYDIINWQLNNGHVPTSLCSNDCPTGTRKAQIRGKPTCCFDCIPCADGTIANFTGAMDCTACPQEYWSNEQRNECIPRTIEFLTYYEPMGIVLTVVALLGASLSLLTMAVFIHYRETPVIKASNSELSCFLLFSLFLCFLCPLTFIGRPTVWTCMLRHTAFGVTFALCISCVLGKTIVVVTAFKVVQPSTKVIWHFGPIQQRCIVCSCTLIQVIICISWLKLKPPFPDKVFRYSNKKIGLECNTGSEVAFYAVLGYIGILAGICLILAFLARKLPDNFNEAKCITFSMLIFCAVWITFIPAYVSSPGKFTVAVEIFAILSSAFGLLISIFAPKCYIILIKPDKNTKKYVMGTNANKKYNLKIKDNDHPVYTIPLPSVQLAVQSKLVCSASMAFK